MTVTATPTVVQLPLVELQSRLDLDLSAVELAVDQAVGALEDLETALEVFGDGCNLPKAVADVKDNLQSGAWLACWEFESDLRRLHEAVKASAAAGNAEGGRS